MVEYEKFEPDTVDAVVNDDATDNADTITPREMVDRIFDGTEKIDPETTLLADFLEKYDLSINELVRIVERYKSGRAIDVTQAIENNKKRAEKIAKELSASDKVETGDVYVAETLIKEYGYKCLTVKADKNGKRWVLEK